MVEDQTRQPVVVLAHDVPPFVALNAADLSVEKLRTTGSLIWAMLLHGFWDFSTFAIGHGTSAALGSITGILYLVVGIFALVAVWWTFPRTDAEKLALQIGASRAGVTGRTSESSTVS